MKPFPYCPEALIKIRNGASAHHLGWDQTFYADVCRKHGVEGVSGHTSDAAKPSATVSANPAATPVPAERTMPRVQYDPRTRTVTRGARSVVLSRRAGQLFEAFAAATPHEFISRDVIARRMGIDPHSVGGFIKFTRMAMDKVRLDIAAAGRGRCGGGYRICCVDTENAVYIEITPSQSSGNTP